ncbi:MAG: hypothetical protein GF418_02270 [Chitinivibrionales bacterium]|nr:hypothetical protein [Chitinivibrionales bacterium]MBD3394427.1 hypothetical protein [Chitinivibrionales bacterium]
MRSQLEFAAAGACMLVFLCAWTHAGQRCELILNCPNDYAGDTLTVPDSIVMLSSSFEHCSESRRPEGLVLENADTVSVMFLIDHSASMGYMDSSGIRYSVVERLIDSIADISPESEIGIVVFANQLMHNHEDDSFFEQLDPSSGWHDSYVPLTKLDSTVGGMAAAEKLKWAIELSTTPNDTDIGGNRRLLHADYGKTGRHDGHQAAMQFNLEAQYNGSTDISLAFDAARKAFESAAYPADKQYIIFLSDGIADSVDVERQDYIDDYIDGEGVPATFTAYWINRPDASKQSVPDEIKTMTDNIRANGYSDNNARSEYWTTYEAEDSLFKQVLRLVAAGSHTTTTSHPTKVSVDGTTSTDIDETMAYFASGFPLTGQYTSFEYAITYRYSDPINRDTTTTFTVTLERSATGTVPDGAETRCWGDGTLELYHDGSAQSLIQPDWTDLEIRYQPSAGQPIDSALFDLANRTGTDSLSLSGDDQGTYFGAEFFHALADAAPDAVLQTESGGSIIIVLRNPDIPLDTVRMVFPVGETRDLRVTDAYYLDRKDGVANGYPDIIRLEIADAMSTDELDLIKSYISIPTVSDRGFTISDMVATAQGVDIILTEPDPSSVTGFTGLYENDRLYIDSVPGLPGGGGFPRVDIALGDSMAPVILSAAYFDLATTRDTLWVVFSEPVKSVGDATPFMFNRIPDILEYDLKLSLASLDSALAGFAVVAEDGQTVPAHGDSVWIDTAANVADLNGVRQEAENVRRALVYRLQYLIESVAYIDTSGDGLIDVVRMWTDRAPDDKMADAVAGTISSWLPSHRNLTVKDVVATSEGFDVRVSQPTGTTPVTSVSAGDSLMTTETVSSNKGYIGATAAAIQDSLAPVIVEAVFLPGIVRREGQNAPDTLKVVFSEDVSISSTSVPLFSFYDADSGDALYTMRFHQSTSGSDETQVFIVTSIDRDVFPVEDDAVRINPAAGLADSLGNEQSNDDNRDVGLTLRAYRYYFSTNAVPNPADPADARVEGSVASLAGKSRGIAIVTEPFARMAPHVSANARIRLYDAVGNLVWDADRGHVDPATKRIVFVWDGTNRKTGRYVGGGTYLGIVEIEDNQDFSETLRFWIGVKKD